MTKVNVVKSIQKEAKPRFVDRMHLLCQGVDAVSSDYVILEAADGLSGLDQYRRSQRMIAWCSNLHCRVGQVSRSWLT